MDALMGNDDRAAGRKGLDNAGHRIRGDAEAVQGFGGAVRDWHWLDLARARHLPPARRALVLVTPLGVPCRRRERYHRPVQQVGVILVDLRREHVCSQWPVARCDRHWRVEKRREILPYI